MCFPLLVIGAFSNNIALPWAHLCFFQPPFENQVLQSLNHTILPWLPISFHPLVSCFFFGSNNLFHMDALWIVLLFIPRQLLITCKLFGPLDDTIIGSTTFRAIYLSLPIPQFKPFQALVMFSQTMAHYWIFFWFWTNLGERGCKLGRCKNFSIIVLWNSMFFWFNIFLTWCMLSLLQNCVHLYL